MSGPRPASEAQAFTVTPAHAGARLDRFVQAMLPRMSRSAVHAALAEGRVELASGTSAKPSRRLVEGEQVVVRSRTPHATPEQPPVLHASADGDWLVVAKPAGMACVPTARGRGLDLASAAGAHPAHRLDKQTSGCVLLTRDAEAARHFEKVFRTGGARKVYGAVVHGRPALERWTCEARIRPAEGARVPGRVEAVRDGTEGDGQDAETLFERVATRRDGARTLLRAFPRTGRRHQVRVHAACCGHPLVGDLLHGGDEREFIRFQLGQPVALEPDLEPGRFLLHARSLEVPGPDGRRVRVIAPWPADFAEELTRSWTD